MLYTPCASTAGNMLTAPLRLLKDAHHSNMAVTTVTGLSQPYEGTAYPANGQGAHRAILQQLCSTRRVCSAQPWLQLRLDMKALHLGIRPSFPCLPQGIEGQEGCNAEKDITAVAPACAILVSGHLPCWPVCSPPRCPASLNPCVVRCHHRHSLLFVDSLPVPGSPAACLHAHTRFTTMKTAQDPGMWSPAAHFLSCRSVLVTLSNQPVQGSADAGILPVGA